MIRARYTTVLKDIMDDPVAGPELEQAMSTYKLYTPLHKELYGYIPNRSELNAKILNHYKYREIGFETVGRFIDELEISLNEIMPKYNQWYKSIDIMNNIEDIFANVDVTETTETESSGISNTEGSGTSETATDTSSSSNANSTTTTESEAENFSKAVRSSTPQGDILGINNKGIDDVTHADEINWSNTSSTDKATNTGSDETSASSEVKTAGSTTDTSNTSKEETSTITFNKRGNQGVNTYAHDMLEFRQLFVNVEQMIINDERISELFMRIW